MKIAVSGKGGVGKTLLSALLCRQFAREGYSVLAIDADPDTNLASALGYPHPDEITPISEMKELIEERTGTASAQSGAFFKLNPLVSDIPDRYAHRLDGIRLMVMGRVKPGGSGCYCAENTILRALMAHLLIARNEVVILDMAAGIEHLGRATAKAVDKLIIVVEPGKKSIETAVRIKKLAGDIGLCKVAAVGNKVRSPADREFIENNLPGFDFMGFIPYEPAIIDADIYNTGRPEISHQVAEAVREIYRNILAANHPPEIRQQ